MEEDLKQYPSLELRTVAGMGRGVFTKVPISAGATIFSALPIAHCSVEKTRGTICEHCFNRSESLKKCTECESVQYCNSDCQKFDLPLHEAECDSVRGVGAPPLVRLALRALTKNTKHLCSLPDGWFTRDDQNDKNQLIADTARLCDYPKCLIRQLFLKLFCNSFIVMSANGMSDVGVAVYSAPSLLNHSCRPNTFALFNGPRLLIKALRDISRGEQLFFPYTKTLQLKSERQTDLQKGYNFTCACERCSEDLPGFSDYDRDLLMGANGKEVPRLLRQEMEKELAELKGLNKRGEWQEVYDKGRALYTSHSTQLSHDNIFSLRLTIHLFQACLELCLWEEALKYSIQILEPSLRHYGPIHPVSVSRLRIIGKLRLYLGTPDQLTLAQDDLTKARKAAMKLYGADHNPQCGLESRLDLKKLSAMIGLPPSLELRTVDGMGRGVFTKVPISAGATIFSELPIAHCSVEETRGTICEHCFNRSESLKKCSRCKFVYYCNSDCQRSDWPLHKTECKGVRGGKATPLVRLALRALTRDTQHLCSLPLNRDGQLLIVSTVQLCKHPPRVINQLFRRITCNTFSVTAPDDLSKMGVALYCAPSLLNHSCRPNTLPLYYGRQLVLKAVRDIGPDEQLFITYTETMQLLSERQHHLQSTYNFTCACERCLEDINQSPGCSEQLLLMAANGKEVPRLLRQEMEEELAELIELGDHGEWQEVYDKGRALYTSHLTKLSPDNIFSLSLTVHLFEASGELSLCEEALKYSIQLLEPSLRHYGLLHPVSVSRLLIIGKLRLCLGTPDQLTLAQDDLTKARTAAERLYGADHRLTREIATVLTKL